MIQTTNDQVLKGYEAAQAVYRAWGVDADQVMRQFREIPISTHCWQGDDVRGFEVRKGAVNQDLIATGNHPGAARNGTQLRQDIDKAFSMSPCKHRVNLHSMYAEPASQRARNDVRFEDFERWAAWARENRYGVDFNASFFTHEMMKNGFSLASPDPVVREYWIKAGIGAREIADGFGAYLGTPCVHNIWIPDGLKDLPANRFAYRERLIESLDRILERPYDRAHVVDTLEGKLFGIGTECFVVGSHEFYLGYATRKGCGVCLDTGHYHPTESVADKLSAIVPFVGHVLLHISRGVRWDSDHVLIQDDELIRLMQEMKRGNLFGKVSMGLDYFDASINRVAAWTIGLRAFGKAVLAALLEPTHLLFAAERDEDFTSRLALMEEFKNLPVNAVWDMLCLRHGVPVGGAWIPDLKRYEQEIQFAR